MAEAAKAGGAAVRNGLDANESRIRGYVDQGLSADKISQGFGEIGTVHDADQAMARRFGHHVRPGHRGGLPDPGAGLREAQAGRAYASEQALFEARPGADNNSLARRTTGSY
jgi:hypothetical protein